MPHADWEFRSLELGACNCDFGCPCQFNSLPTHGNCRAAAAGRVSQGHFGGVPLDGLCWAMVCAWPGAVHEGGGEGIFVIDESADEAQRDALFKIVTGKETEPGATMFNVFTSMMSKVHDPVYRRIEFECDMESRRGRFRVEGLVDTEVHPIVNAMTGAEHRARVTLPHGFEFTTAEFAANRTKAWGPIQHDWEDGHAHLCELHLGPNGPIR